MAGVVKAMMSMVLLAVVIIAVAPPHTEGAVSCGSVASYLSSCIPYVTNKGPIGNCCSGIKGLYAAAATPADRQQVCSCLKTISGQYSGINYGKAAGLPGQCGVNVPYKITPSTDCSKVQ